MKQLGRISMVYTEALLGSLTCFSILTACYKARTQREQYYGGNTTTSTTQKKKIVKILPTRRVTRVRTWVFPIWFRWSQDRDSANRVMVVVRSTTRPRLVTCCQNRKELVCMRSVSGDACRAIVRVRIPGCVSKKKN